MTTNTKRYESPQDVQMRLNHSYVRYKGKGAWVSGCVGHLLTLRKGLGAHDEFTVNSEDPELDISAPPTGYCLDTEEMVTFWLARFPMRQQKQGLDQHNGVAIAEFTDFKANTAHFPNLPSVINMIDGKYDTVDQAISRIQSGRYQSAPFDRNFCLVGLSNAKAAFGLRFMAQPLGILEANSRVGLVSPKYAGSPVLQRLSRFVPTIEVVHDAA